ncbi:MAG: T9SS type A sorting domain-containing protein [Fluviicola sp.]|nr:T9SS type A sorting domain-containing protein [Fluviicola sp.]
MKIILLTFLFFNSGDVICQLNNELLDQNNTSALIYDVGNFFYDFNNSGQLGYEAPKNIGFNSLYTTQFWMSGITNLGDTNFVLGGSYDFTSGNVSRDLFNGPYSSNSSYMNTSYQARWDTSMWKFCQEEIDDYLRWWNCDNGLLQPADCIGVTQPSQTTRNKLISWPGNGDVLNGEAYFMAPFYDNPNGPSGQDLLYSPFDGDVPIIKGCCSVYLIQNDEAEIKGYSGTGALGVEAHYQFYQYKTWDFLNDVTFIDVFIVNRSSENLSNFTYGIMGDIDIGSPFDDYIGSDSVRNVMYIYNGDSLDSPSIYAEKPPAFGFISLSHDLSSVVERSNSVNQTVLWNELNGLQPNGLPILNQNGSPTKFIYSGDPNVPTDWNDGPFSGDRRGLMAIDKGNFISGDTIRQTYAIIYAGEGDYLQNVQGLFDVADQVQLFYDSGMDTALCVQGTLGLQEETLSELSLEIYPNPSDGVVHLENKNSETLIISVFDITGTIVFKKSKTNKYIIDLDMAKYGKGVYLIQIESEHAKLTRRVIIQ